MYTESDLQSAIAAGILAPEAADALRAHVAERHALPPADEESIRLISGFNDIFVAIACLLVIFSGFYAGGDRYAWLGGLVVAVASWIMAEIFSRKRRMALPSIIVLAAFVAGLGVFAGSLAALALPEHTVSHSFVLNGETRYWTNEERFPWENAVIALCGAVVAGIGAIAHWKRFRVAITIAAGIAALALTLLAALAAITGQDLFTSPVLAPAALACGLAVFAFAMRWDLSDRERRTQRADIAFWLHLLAAPLIVHPLFYWMGVLRHGNVATAQGLGVLAIYLVFAVVALVADRRALLVSALLYVLMVLNRLLDKFGTIKFNLAIAALVIGCALLALSVFWAPLRRALVRPLPAKWQARLPVTI